VLRCSSLNPSPVLLCSLCRLGGRIGLWFLPSEGRGGEEGRVGVCGVGWVRCLGRA